MNAVGGAAASSATQLARPPTGSRRGSEGLMPSRMKSTVPADYRTAGSPGGDTAAGIMREIADEEQRADVRARDLHLNASAITAEWYDSLSDAPFAVALTRPPT